MWLRLLVAGAGFAALLGGVQTVEAGCGSAGKAPQLLSYWESTARDVFVEDYQEKHQLTAEQMKALEKMGVDVAPEDFAYEFQKAYEAGHKEMISYATKKYGANEWTSKTTSARLIGAQSGKQNEQKGKLATSGTERTFITVAPFGSNTFDFKITRTGGKAKPNLTICTVDANKKTSQLVNVKDITSYSKNNISGVKGKLILIHLGKGVGNKYEYTLKVTMDPLPKAEPPKPDKSKWSNPKARFAPPTTKDLKAVPATVPAKK